MATEKSLDGKPYAGNPHLRLMAHCALRRLALVNFALLAGSPLRGAEYDAASVDELVLALAAAGADDVVKLAPGCYELPEEPCSTNQIANTGCSHLYVNTHLKGMGETREETLLFGRGAYRILAVSADGVVENLTVSNGYASAYGDLAYAKRGGGAYGTGRLVNCLVTHCSALEYGGGAGGAMTLRSCRVENCSAKNGGGAYSSSAYATWFVGNAATEGSGGGAYRAEFYDCVVSNNTATICGGGAYTVTYGTNTLFTCNVCDVSGGGVGNLDSGDGELVDCEISRNRANMGGGIFGARLIARGGSVHDNYSTKHGGGAYGCLLKGVTLSTNICGNTGNNAYEVRLEDCDVSGTDVSWGSAARCVFHHIGGTVSLAGNPHSSASQDCTDVWKYYPNATNCLFRDNTLGASGSLLLGVSTAVKASTLVNCTVVSNVYASLFNSFKTDAYPLTVVNCVFFGNRTSADAGRDINFTASAAKASFSHSAFGVKPQTLDLTPFSDGTLYQFGTDGFGPDPLFQGGDEHPYMTLDGSPLRGAGVYEAWMSNATDIRGMARFRRACASAVDIGCYQHWPVFGLRMTFR